MSHFFLNSDIMTYELVAPVSIWHKCGGGTYFVSYLKINHKN